MSEVLEAASDRWAAGRDGNPTPAEIDRLLTDALAAAIRKDRSVTYVSTPITTGPEFIAWWRNGGQLLRPSDPAYVDEINRVIQANIRRVRPLVERVEVRFHTPVIDPTRLGPIAGWTQAHYHDFWVRVITRFAAAVVFSDGWNYSSGCALEFAAAVKTGAQLMDSAFQRLAMERGRHLILQAADELDSIGLDATQLRRALRAIDVERRISSSNAAVARAHPEDR